MKKVKAILWALWIKISAPFRKRMTKEEIVERLVEDHGWKGTIRKPFKNAIPFEYHPETGEIRPVILMNEGKRAFQTPGTI